MAPPSQSSSLLAARGRPRASHGGAPAATFPGPSRRITVEPVEVPVVAPPPMRPAEPAREPPTREPPPAVPPAREPAPSP
jgi:hypothetical protein